VFRGWVRRLFAPLARDLERPPAGNGELERRDARAQALMVLGLVGHDGDVLDLARRAVLGGDAAATPSDPETAQVLTNLAAWLGDAAVFDRVVANIEDANSPGVQERNIEALGYFSDPALVQRALEYALSPRVDARLLAGVIARALENRDARNSAWPFVKAHWRDIVARIGLSDAAEAVLDAAATFCDAALRDEVATFLDARGLGREATSRLEPIRACLDFRSAQRGNFERWVRKVAY
jgi:hypothetical protein